MTTAYGSDAGDFDWRGFGKAMREAASTRKACRRVSAEGTLTRAGVAFTSHNAGAHLVIRRAGAVVDFWPGTGTWIYRGSGHRGRGFRPLLQALAIAEMKGKR